MMMVLRVIWDLEQLVREWEPRRRREKEEEGEDKAG